MLRIDRAAYLGTTLISIAELTKIPSIPGVIKTTIKCVDDTAQGSLMIGGTNSVIYNLDRYQVVSFPGSPEFWASTDTDAITMIVEWEKGVI